MCDYEEFIFTCSHSVIRLKCYCHFARNHPSHYCNRVKKLRACWYQPVACDDCLESERQRQEAYYRYMQSQGQGQGQGGGVSQ